MRAIFGFIVLSVVLGVLFGVSTHTQSVAGVATDHGHTVSQAEFVRVLRGNGAPTTNYQQAYNLTVDTCNVLMRARWQDRDRLAALYPASIQDATLRYEVYTAINSGKVCVA